MSSVGSSSVAHLAAEATVPEAHARGGTSEKIRDRRSEIRKRLQQRLAERSGNQVPSEAPDAQEVVSERHLRANVGPAPSTSEGATNDHPQLLRSPVGTQRPRPQRVVGERVISENGERQGGVGTEQVVLETRDAESGAQTEADGTADEDVGRCAICLEGEPRWVYESCGHRCICKSCARKQKEKLLRAPTAKGRGAKKKTPLVMCPLCRAETRVIPGQRFDGDIFD